MSNNNSFATRPLLRNFEKGLKVQAPTVDFGLTGAAFIYWTCMDLEGGCGFDPFARLLTPTAEQS